jgi:Ca2+-binding RTX toxin-like protein
MGGDGDDFLNGGSGRSILIGGRGKDRLVGASGDDILIGGYTIYEGNALVFCALLEEWNSGEDYETRVARLRLLLNATTVLDDGEVDMLTGSSGFDWFFDGAGDIITRVQNDEIVE